MDALTSSRLAADLLQRGYQVRLRVTGRSMLPLFVPNTVLTLEPVTDLASIALGDVAFVFCGGAHRLHRIVQLTPQMRTKGDALAQIDPPLVAVYGRVIGNGGCSGRAAASLSRLAQPMQRLMVRLRYWR